MLNQLLIVSTLLVLGCLFFLYLKNKNQLNRSKTQVAATHSQLQLSYEVEEHLREELTVLQNKLEATFEDPITNLLGWQLFEDRIQHALRESERYQLTMGVLFVDIDDFKVINDALSYEVGDSLLREVAARLESCIRQVDSVTRFTKDTFVVLLNQLAKPETAAIVAQRILQNFREMFFVQDHELAITVSIGIAIYPTDGETSAELLRSADHALHLAKNCGKHSYKFYQERMHTQSVRELAIYTHLSRESVFEEFNIYYQPIVDVLHETIFGMDAILHWQPAQLGPVSAEEVFAYAGKQQKLNAITEWLIEHACAQFLKWRALGFAPPCVGIPVSIKQLDNSQFIYSISQRLQSLSFNPDWLLLELKELRAISSIEGVEKALNMLKYLGVRVAIDNFGSEHSFSLLDLKNLKLKYLKLDPALIDDIAHSEKTVSIIESIIYLAKKMSSEIIVQGVESPEQIEILKKLGCTLMQGRLLGPPLSESEVAKKLLRTTD